jgi:pimeloyl-ACP methyl ester carboxylesterase
MIQLFTATTRTTSAASTAVVVAFGTIVVAAFISKKKRNGWWNSNDNKDRIVQRENNIRRTAAALVGPNPQWISVTALPTVKNDEVDTDNSINKTPDIQMLTTYYKSNSSNSSSRSSTANKDQQPIITAVIIHGFGCTSLEFGQFIKLLQSHTSTSSLNIFTYDRVLFVQDECQQAELWNKPRDAMTLALELHALLQNRRQGQEGQEGGVTTKPAPSHHLLLIGHSYGGLIAQLYANMYPDQVHGMVLIDPAHEEQFQKFPIDFTLSFTTVVPVILNLYQRIAWTGILIWLDYWSLFNFPPLFLLQPQSSSSSSSSRDDKNNNPVRQACVQLYSQADGSVWKIVAAELQGCMETFDRMNHDDDDDHGDDDHDGYKFRRRQEQHVIPTGLVIAGNRRYSPTLFPKKVTRAFLEMHATCLSHARVFMANDSDHWVHMSEPEVVLEAVQYVLDELKKKMHA